MKFLISSLDMKKKGKKVTAQNRKRAGNIISTEEDQCIMLELDCLEDRVTEMD